ncbi:MAG: hypothetical protein RR586_05705 [Cellulosilyticaceae bacterium]
MVINLVKWIVVFTMGINVLCVNGQAYINGETVETVKDKNKEIEGLLEEKIEESLNESQDMKWMTSQNKVLEVQWKEGHVTVNLHKDIIGYGGGTYTEYILGALIMEAVFENSEAESLTILVNGTSEQLPEGSDYSNCSRENYNDYYQLDNPKTEKQSLR